jgi:hypothetical protein
VWNVEAPFLEPEKDALMTTFGKCTKKIRRQTLVEFTISSDRFKGVFTLSPQLANDANIGSEFLILTMVLRKASQTNNYQESAGK